MRFKKVVGGSRGDAEKKFPWLQRAVFRGAVIDITKDYLTWEDGIWMGGVWEDGIWMGGVWVDGTWKGGVWKGGLMWSNLTRRYVKVTQRRDGTLKEGVR